MSGRIFGNLIFCRCDRNAVKLEISHFSVAKSTIICAADSSSLPYTATRNRCRRNRENLHVISEVSLVSFDLCKRYIPGLRNHAKALQFLQEID